MTNDGDDGHALASTDVYSDVHSRCPMLVDRGLAPLGTRERERDEREKRNQVRGWTGRRRQVGAPPVVAALRLAELSPTTVFLDGVPFAREGITERSPTAVYGCDGRLQPADYSRFLAQCVRARRATSG